MTFNWYEEVNSDEEITQGDILLNFPIVKINNYDELLDDNVCDKELDAEIEYTDYIILTQPCDLARPKPELENVILCKIHDVDASGLAKNRLIEIIQGNAPQFYMLNKNEYFNYVDEKNDFKIDIFNYHIVNFDIIEKVPISAVKKYVKNIKKRLRLLPPYREHLSQAFAKYFMRIGLPNDIDRSDFNKYSKGKSNKSNT
ncbi:hypothetical protein [Clostridium butyricum]